MNDQAKALIDKLFETGDLSRGEFTALIDGRNEESADYLFEKARIRRTENYGNKVYLRGLIEFTNYCRNNCLYCGIRAGNAKCERYRLTKEEILLCADQGHELGFRTFVLQGGEDPFYTDEMISDIVRALKKNHPDSAVTLSVGERSRETYQAWFDAGADRYLLRHETADKAHYEKLHPSSMSFENRVRCLYDLKEIGYQTGAGMMLESPYQTTDNIVTDLKFLKDLKPEMIGIGPFIPHKDTPFAGEKAGGAELTLFMLGILRLMFPAALIPATTALGTVDGTGREKGINAGANVVMPNLSPVNVREKYLLYDGKICTGDEAAACIKCMQLRISKVGCEAVISRGDAKGFEKRT